MPADRGGRLGRRSSAHRGRRSLRSWSIRSRSRVGPGRTPPPDGSGLVDWITGSTWRDRTIRSAIPPIYARYSTVVVPDGDTAKTLADVALVEVLQGHTTAQPWWLGHLDTGLADLVAADVPMVAVYDGWRCVGGPAPLVDGLLLRPDLQVRAVTPDQDATPPGRSSG